MNKFKLWLYRKLQKELEPFLNKELTEACEHDWDNFSSSIKIIDTREKLGHISEVDYRCKNCGKWKHETHTDVNDKTKPQIEIWDFVHRNDKKKKK